MPQGKSCTLIGWRRRTPQRLRPEDRSCRWRIAAYSRSSSCRPSGCRCGAVLAALAVPGSSGSWSGQLLRALILFAGGVEGTERGVASRRPPLGLALAGTLHCPRHCRTEPVGPTGMGSGVGPGRAGVRGGPPSRLARPGKAGGRARRGRAGARPGQAGSGRGNSLVRLAGYGVRVGPARRGRPHASPLPPPPPAKILLRGGGCCNVANRQSIIWGQGKGEGKDVTPNGPSPSN